MQYLLGLTFIDTLHSIDGISNHKVNFGSKEMGNQVLGLSNVERKHAPQLKVTNFPIKINKTNLEVVVYYEDLLSRLSCIKT